MAVYFIKASCLFVGENERDDRGWHIRHAHWIFNSKQGGAFNIVGVVERNTASGTIFEHLTMF